MKKLLLGAASLTLITACAHHKDAAPPEAPSAARLTPAKPVEELKLSAPDVLGEWGLNTDTKDASVRPGDDFNAYVNGAWISSFEIPADQSRYGSFDLLREKSEPRVRFIIDDLAAASPEIDTPEGKIGAIYNAYMNTDAINAAGLEPAAPYFARIDAVSNLEDLAKLTASVGYASPIGGFVFVDDKDPETYIFQMSLGGLGMPDRDYYLKDDEKSLELRARYLDLLTFMLGQAGYADAATKAADVMAFETEIAKLDWDRTVSRNPEVTYNKLSRE